MSSAIGRTSAAAPGPAPEVTRSASPRTTATGWPASLPFARSAAEAISSATAVTVWSRTLPCASVRPRRSCSGSSPATPTAWSTRPIRHGRPKVSLTTTATSTPRVSSSCERSARADASGSTGSRTTVPAAVLLVSTPADASTKPCRVCAIVVRPRLATTRSVSDAIASSRSIASTRPSALATTFDVTTSTSPSCSAGPDRCTDCAMSAARSSPADTSGMSSSAQTCRPPASAVTAPPGRPPGRARRAPSLWSPTRRTSSTGRRGRGSRRPRPRAPQPRRARRPASRRAGRARSARATASALASTPIAASTLSAMPRTGAPPTIGDSPTTGAAVSRTAASMPGTARIVPMLTTGLDGGSSTTSAVAIASSTPGTGLGVLDADRDDGVGDRLRAQPHPVLLEVHRPASGLVARALLVVDHDVGLHPVIAHRQQRDAVGPEPPALAQGGGDGAERVARHRASGSGRRAWPGRGRPARTTPAPRRTGPAPPGP